MPLISPESSLILQQTNKISSLITFLQNNGYLMIFIIMIIEGPIATSIAAFLASLGILNIYMIFFLAFLGNFLPDIFFYMVGRLSRKHIEDYIVYFGIKKANIKKLEKGFKNHAKKTIVMVKLTPILPIPGLILSGFTKVSFKTFIWTIILFNFISSIVFISIGFYGGVAIGSIFRYFKLGSYAILFLIPLAAFIYWMSKKLPQIVIRLISKERRIKI